MLAVMNDSFDSMGFSNPALEAIELVDVRILEPIPQDDGGTVSVQGRLRKHAKCWLNDLDVSSFERDIVLYGYHLPFAVLPWPVFKFNHRSALQYEEFVVSAIADLQAGCIVQSDECPLICSPLGSRECQG